jgi:phage FluMu gp28-like protein
MHLITKPTLTAINLADFFLPHQIEWIDGEEKIHSQGRQAIALAEKSVRIGWTYADAFKNVRKRLEFADRDYLFATKDYASALEYVRQCYKFAEVFDLTRTIKTHGEELLSINRVDGKGRPSPFTDEVKVGVIKFDNGSRIIAFSANPQAMAVYGGDVGLDEFAKHPNARLLWETAQGRVTWGYDLAIWSSHDGEDTLFNEFAQEARAACDDGRAKVLLRDQINGQSSSSALPISEVGTVALRGPSLVGRVAPRAPGLEGIERTEERLAQRDGRYLRGHDCPRSGVTDSISEGRVTRVPLTQSGALGARPSESGRVNVPWNLYYRVTIVDAVNNGLVEVINKSRGTKFTHDQFLGDCKARARDEEIFQQAYMCNPLGASTNHIVEWGAIERCRYDYQIDRVHLEAADIEQKFGAFSPGTSDQREEKICDFLGDSLPLLKQCSSSLRLGFDVAASGQGDLAVIYLDEVKGDIRWLRALITCRTEDWHFLKTTLFALMASVPDMRGAGDETGLGRQICWEAAQAFGSRWKSVNFASAKHDLGFTLMNQLSVADKRFPRCEHDIASDFFALKKVFNGNRWAFAEGKNALNPVSHCDIAWAGALASEAPQRDGPGAYVA